jgi:hypothetical protein
VVLEFFVLLFYAIEKVGSKNYSAVRAKKKARNWLRRIFLRIPSCDDKAEQRDWKLMPMPIATMYSNIWKKLNRMAPTQKRNADDGPLSPNTKRARKKVLNELAEKVYAI